MINAFNNIGYSILKKDGYFETENILEKRKILLFHQSLILKEKKDKKGNKILNGRAICLNFDLENKEIEFKLSEKELIEEHRESFFAFRLAAPKDKKKFLSTNNVTTFFTSLFKESIEYINDKNEKRKSKLWFYENVSYEYRQFLEEIYNQFFVKIDKSIFLDYKKLAKDQMNIFNNIKEEYPKEKTDEWYKRFLNKKFFNSESKNIFNFPYIFIITFNNLFIQQYEKGKYNYDYISLCYYDLLKRFSIENSKNNKHCHICKKNKDVMQDLPLPMKFYGTTNNLNFEQVSKSNAYKSFAVCEECLFQIMTGMKYIENVFAEYMFDLNTYLIPINQKEITFDPKLYKGIIKILKTKKSQYQTEIEQIETILKKANRKNLYFNLMFYYHPPGSQQFDIIKLISNIELNKLILKLEMFDEMTKIYKLDEIGNGTNALTINNLRYYLFPSFLSHKNPDYNVYSQDLVNFLESFLTDYKIEYQMLIQRFIIIFKKRLNRNNINELSAFKMNLFISIFFKLKLIKEGGKMDTGKTVSEVMKKEYQEFFDVHYDVYGHNAFKQGLFLLGTVISKIKYAQKEKSSNFLKKLNFEGIPIRRIPALINQVKDFEDIYRKKIFQEAGIWGNILDRLQGIEKSNMKPDEVVFYLLSGISYEDYLGMKRGYEKKLEENKNEGEEK